MRAKRARDLALVVVLVEAPGGSGVLKSEWHAEKSPHEETSDVGPVD